MTGLVAWSVVPDRGECGRETARMSQVTMLRRPLQLEPDTLGKNRIYGGSGIDAAASWNAELFQTEVGPESSVSRAMWNTPRSPMEGM